MCPFPSTGIVETTYMNERRQFDPIQVSNNYVTFADEAPPSRSQSTRLLLLKEIRLFWLEVGSHITLQISDQIHRSNSNEKWDQGLKPITLLPESLQWFAQHFGNFIKRSTTYSRWAENINRPLKQLVTRPFFLGLFPCWNLRQNIRADFPVYWYVNAFQLISWYRRSLRYKKSRATQ